MKSKLKKTFVSFLIMTSFGIAFSSPQLWHMGWDSIHVGLLYVLGLLFGPYGALGAVLGNVIIDLADSYTPLEILPSAIISFGVSYLAYKLWYSGLKLDRITKPRLNNIYQLVLFLSTIFICGFIFSVPHGNLVSLIYSKNIEEYISISYILNFTNTAFIFGIIGIWLSKRFDFTETPKKSKKPVNKRLYRILFCLLILSVIISFIISIWAFDKNLMIAETIVISILLFAYLTKPFGYEIEESAKNTIIENIMWNFLALTLIIAIFGILISFLSYNFVTTIDNIYIDNLPLLIIPDAIIILFFIPAIILLKHVEDSVIKPISSFSEIENFIKENEKIEAEGLLNIYSDYINEKNEIGTLARSYTNLIEHNNNYIENIKEIEGDKERIKAELDIATRIQAAALPTESLANDDFIVDGYSHPAKEVGGDFFDYYMIDEDNLAIVIGDASGKGVPAALLAMITQVIIKQMFKQDKDPSKILYSLNNQLSENNPESMFLTLWLGIYNKTTKKLTFSNAGHNPPLIKENGEFKYLNMDEGIILGILGDYDYVKEELNLSNEIVLYTDGITDAPNKDYEIYGEDGLLDFFNEFKTDDDPIIPLLNDIHNFTQDAEQFDDMTLLYFKIK